MLKRYKVDMNGGRKSPLLYALRRNNEEMVKFILSQVHGYHKDSVIIKKARELKITSSCTFSTISLSSGYDEPLSGSNARKA